MLPDGVCPHTQKAHTQTCVHTGTRKHTCTHTHTHTHTNQVYKKECVKEMKKGGGFSFTVQWRRGEEGWKSGEGGRESKKGGYGMEGENTHRFYKTALQLFR